MNPRLGAAFALVEAGGVSIAADRTSATVRARDVTHHITIDADGMHCTCPWYAKNKGHRGPCKHALAVEIVLGADN